MYRIDKSSPEAVATGEQYDSAYTARCARRVKNMYARHGEVFVLHTGTEHPSVLPWGERVWADPQKAGRK